MASQAPGQQSIGQPIVKEDPQDDAEYLRQLQAQNVWRKAVQVDGELRWCDDSGTRIGDLVPKDRPWKMHGYGTYMLLAPVDDKPDNESANRAVEELDPQTVIRDANLYELLISRCCGHECLSACLPNHLSGLRSKSSRLCSTGP